jgi:hypothetical protein
MYIRRREDRPTLLDVGADMFALDKEKRSGLVMACQRGHLEVVRVIHAHLVSRFPEAKDLVAAQKKGGFLKLDKWHRLPIFHAVKNGHFALTKFLLVEVGSPVDATDSSDNNLLHYAAAYGWSSLVRLSLTFVKHSRHVDRDRAARRCGQHLEWKTTPLFIEGSLVLRVVGALILWRRKITEQCHGRLIQATNGRKGGTLSCTYSRMKHWLPQRCSCLGEPKIDRDDARIHVTAVDPSTLRPR